MPNSHPSGVVNTFLVAGILLVAVMAIFLIAGMRIEVECPNCRGEGNAFCLVDDWWHSHKRLPRIPKGGGMGLTRCARCDATGKVAFIPAWLDKPPAEVMPGMN